MHLTRPDARLIFTMVVPVVGRSSKVGEGRLLGPMDIYIEVGIKHSNLSKSMSGGYFSFDYKVV